jgi:aminopeptidase N
MVLGYYRINYDQDIWLRIRTALNKPNFDGIHVLNRAQIVDDFYNFAKVSLHPFSEVLELFRFLKEDTSYYPWYSAFNAFSNMLLRTGDETIRSSLSVLLHPRCSSIKQIFPGVYFATDGQTPRILGL